MSTTGVGGTAVTPVRELKREAVDRVDASSLVELFVTQGPTSLAAAADMRGRGSPTLSESTLALGNREISE
jgi:hypothetical protein